MRFLLHLLRTAWLTQPATYLRTYVIAEMYVRTYVTSARQTAKLVSKAHPVQFSQHLRFCRLSSYAHLLFQFCRGGSAKQRHHPTRFVSFSSSLPNLPTDFVRAEASQEYTKPPLERETLEIATEEFPVANHIRIRTPLARTRRRRTARRRTRRRRYPWKPCPAPHRKTSRQATTYVRTYLRTYLRI